MSFAIRAALQPACQTALERLWFIHFLDTEDENETISCDKLPALEIACADAVNKIRSNVVKFGTNLKVSALRLRTKCMFPPSMGHEMFSLVMRMQHITLENKQSVKGGVFTLKGEVDMKEVLMLHVLLLCAKNESPSHGVV